MDAQLKALTALALDVQSRRTLEELLTTVADGAVGIVGARHASLRLVDAQTGQLLSALRKDAERAPAFTRGHGLLGWIAANCEPLLTNDPTSDPRFEARDDTPSMASFLGVPLLAGQSCVGVLAVLDKPGGFRESDQAILTLIAAICAPYVQIARLARLSAVDVLTGTLNRRGLEGFFEREPARERRTLSVLMVDVDHFKQINDRYGHAVGDQVLQHLARALARQTRDGDALVRWGGEEFLVVLPQTPLERARVVAERTRASVERTPAPIGEGIRLTVSIGVAQLIPGESREDTIARADAAMYRAKQHGRNRVEVAAPNEAPEDAGES